MENKNQTHFRRPVAVAWAKPGKVLAATSSGVPARDRRGSPRLSPALPHPCGGPAPRPRAATLPQTLTKESQATSTTLGRGWSPGAASRGLAPAQGAAAIRSNANPASPSGPPPRIAPPPSPGPPSPRERQAATPTADPAARRSPGRTKRTRRGGSCPAARSTSAPRTTAPSVPRGGGGGADYDSQHAPGRREARTTSPSVPEEKWRLDAGAWRREAGVRMRARVRLHGC